MPKRLSWRAAIYLLLALAAIASLIIHGKTAIGAGRASLYSRDVPLLNAGTSRVLRKLSDGAFQLGG